MIDESNIKKIMSDAFTEYSQAYRQDETEETMLFPRNMFPDIVSYQAAKVIAYLNVQEPNQQSSQAMLEETAVMER